MVHINISHLDYSEAFSALMATIREPGDIICRIDFDADHRHSKVIRDFVWAVFDRACIGAPWRGRFILITDELTNNAIEHGSLIGDIDSCYITARHDPALGFSIVLEVHDTGRGKDAKDATHMQEIKDAKMHDMNDSGVYMAKRGRGLFHITEKLVDRLSFAESEHGWLAVKIEKNIQVGE
jgi:anti-sigma regulatory factor (Ser/Thr protein kinase)